MAAASSLLREFDSHLTELSTNQSGQVNARLFDEAQQILPAGLGKSEQLILIQRLAQLLLTKTIDPKPFCSLLIKLLNALTWPEICQLLNEHQIPIWAGLEPTVEAVPFNHLVLSILGKATHDVVDAAHVASLLEPIPVIQSLVRCWLQTPDIGVATLAQDLLILLLRIDRPLQADSVDTQLPTGGIGHVWKRIFGDRNVYEQFFSSCTLTSSSNLSKREKTLAQGRLLQWLTAVAGLDWQMICKSHHPDIEKAHGVDGGLLDYAALIMVDFEDDVLMYACLIDFYKSLLSLSPFPSDLIASAEISPYLQYLIEHGLHARMIDSYLADGDVFPAMFIKTPVADYISEYASRYRDHFLRSGTSLQITDRLYKTFSSNMREYPVQDLHVLQSIPRQTLLPMGTQGILTLLSTRKKQPEVFLTLGRIFGGPDRPIITYPSASPLMTLPTNTRDQVEASHARALYYHYIDSNPNFWTDIVADAQTLALKDIALAAIDCLNSVINANWAMQNPPQLADREREGFLALLVDPAAKSILPYLTSPSFAFTGVVRDTEATSTANLIAAGKSDCQRAMRQKLSSIPKEERASEIDALVAFLDHQLAGGSQDRHHEAGSRIETIGM